MNATARTVDCPACGVATVYSVQNRSRPFCSERCRTADLGAWATESYVVVGEVDPLALEAEDARSEQ